MRWGWRACWGLVALLTAGCPARLEPRTPAQVTQAHLEALGEGDRARAWAWMSPEARQRGVPLPDAPPASEAGAELRREARWASDDGEDLVLVRDAQGWRISRGVLGLGRTSTPQEAVRTFARAVAASDYGLLMRLVPAAHREALTPALLAERMGSAQARAWWAQAAESFSAGPVELEPLEPGQKVRARAGDKELLLVREPDGWKVLDVRPWPPYDPRP